MYSDHFCLGTPFWMIRPIILNIFTSFLRTPKSNPKEKVEPLNLPMRLVKMFYTDHQTAFETNQDKLKTEQFSKNLYKNGIT